MARVAGVDLPKNKRIDVALTYLYGIGKATSNQLLEKLNGAIDPTTRHFSGTARYELEFEVPAGFLLKGRKLMLDLEQFRFKCLHIHKRRSSLCIRSRRPC